MCIGRFRCESLNIEPRCNVAWHRGLIILNEALDRPLPNSYWVVPGRLLAGEYPGGSGFTESRARLAKLQDAGVDYFVDLTEEAELPPYRHLLPFRVKYLRSPIVDTRVQNNVAQTRELLAAIRDALARERGVYVHCRAGIGRTGLIIGCFLAEQECDGKAALKALNRLWLQSERSQTWPKVPQTAEQAAYVRGWLDLAKTDPARVASDRAR